MRIALPKRRKVFVGSPQSGVVYSGIHGARLRAFLTQASA